MGIDNKFSIEELSALDEKFETPEKTVRCPRCGKLLLFREFSGSCVVECQTEGCLHDVLRGL